MFNRVLRDSSLLVELKYENAAELLGFALVCFAVFCARDEVLDLIHGVFCADSNSSIDTTGTITVLGFAARSPLDDELLFSVRV